MRITIFQSEFLKDESGRFRSFSSEPDLDKAMSSVLSYFALVTVDEAQELTGVLSRGSNRQGEGKIFEPVSFAVVHNMHGEDIGIPVVLWMHGRAVMQLSQSQYEINYKYTFPNFSGRA